MENLNKEDINEIVDRLFSAMKPLLPSLIAVALKGQPAPKCLLAMGGERCAHHGMDCALGTVLQLRRRDE